MFFFLAELETRIEMPEKCIWWINTSDSELIEGVLSFEDDDDDEDICSAWFWIEDSLLIARSPRILLPSCKMVAFVTRVSRTSLSDCLSANPAIVWLRFRVSRSAPW
jgi:hypothetical protein